MRIRSRGVAGAALIVGMALVLPGCGSGGSHRPEIKTTVRAGVAPLPPERDGAYFGAWVDPAAQPLGDFEHAMGRTLDIAEIYREWESAFPTQADSDLLKSGHLVLLSLIGGDTQKISSGKMDKAVRDWAQKIKNTGKPIFLRWDPTMDATGARQAVHSANSYVAAWKRLREQFKAVKADNVAWVWCPSSRGFDAAQGATPPGHAADFYPGDDQVDWICTDAFPDPKDPTNSLSQVLKPFLDWSANHPKPLMISEFGVPRSFGGRRAEWLRKAAQTLQNPQVKAVLYADSSKYALTGDDAAISAVRELATSPFFNPRNLPVQSN